MLKALALIVGLAASAFAQVPPVQLTPASFRDFSGGLVDTVDPANLQPGQSPDLQNVTIDDPAGSIKPRMGFTQCGKTPSGNPATALYEYSRVDGTKRLIVSDNATVWETRDCVTFTRMTHTLASTALPDFATVRDKLWMVNGSSHPFTWNGGTMTVMDARATNPIPAPPKGSYIEFWKERVWIARTSGDPSIVQFSSLEDTLGNDIDPSTGSAAWPATNAFYIDQDAGSAITGLRSYRNRLFVFKDNGIWEIRFNSVFDNAINKTAASIGARCNTCITEVEGILYFVGKDGIYAFDGENAVLVSREIDNTFRTIRQSLVNAQYKIWTTQGDFAAGVLSSATATIMPASVLISTQQGYVEGGSFESSSISPFICGHDGGSPRAGSYCNIQSSTAAITGSYSLKASGNCTFGTVQRFHWLFDSAGSTLTTGFASAPFDLSPSPFSLGLANWHGQVVRLKIVTNTSGSSDNVTVWSTTFTAIGSSVTFNWSGSQSCSGGSQYTIFDDFENAAYFSSAVITSDKYNAVSVSSWTTFEANSVANGGTLAYAIRLAATEGGIDTAAWTPIVPGSVINSAPSNIYIQWRATFTAPGNLERTPELEDVSVNYTQGGNTKQPIHAYAWKNRMLVNGSTGTVTYNNLTMIKSRVPINSWVPHNLAIGAMTIFSDNFYAAASSHSAIYRMDYGTNDNGNPIAWHWVSRDELWGNPYVRKNLKRLSVDFRKDTAANAQIGYSLDSGATFTNKTVDMSGSGRGAKTIFSPFGGNALAYRFRIGSTSLDDSATVTGIAGWAELWRLEEQ